MHWETPFPATAISTFLNAVGFCHTIGYEKGASKQTKRSNSAMTKAQGNRIEAKLDCIHGSKFSQTIEASNKHAFLMRRLIPYVREWGGRREQKGLMAMDINDPMTKDWIRERCCEDLRLHGAEIWSNVYYFISKFVEYNATFWPEGEIDENDPLNSWLPFYALVSDHSALVVACVRIMEMPIPGINYEAEDNME